MLSIDSTVYKRLLLDTTSSILVKGMLQSSYVQAVAGLCVQWQLYVSADCLYACVLQGKDYTKAFGGDRSNGRSLGGGGDDDSMPKQSGKKRRI